MNEVSVTRTWWSEWTWRGCYDDDIIKNPQMRLSWDEMIQLYDDDVHDDVVLFMELGFAISKTCYLIWISLFIYSILNKNKPKDNMTSTMSTTSKFSHQWCRFT